MTLLLLEVVDEFLLQPQLTPVQPGTHRHEQWHGVPYVVIRLREEGQVQLARHLAAQRARDDWHGLQLRPVGCRTRGQFSEVRHRVLRYIHAA